MPSGESGQRAAGTVIDQPQRLRRYIIGLAAGWTLITCVSLGLDLANEWQAAAVVAREGASSAAAKDLLYRRWNAQHGMVYVPATKETPPNPYLAHVPERDITTPSGRVLTLVNPTYMSRQMHELSSREGQPHGRLTSLNPLNPKNAPDAWERAALTFLAGGAKEYHQVVPLDGRRHLRLLSPMLVEADCLECHGGQGYKVGDIRGGVSVAVDMAPYESAALAKMIPLSIGHGVLWCIGLAGIVVGTRHLRDRILEREQAKGALRESERRFQDAVANTEAGYFRLDAEGRYQEVNGAWARMYKLASEDEVIGSHFRDVHGDAEAEQLEAVFRKVLERGEVTTGEASRCCRDGSTGHHTFAAGPVREERGLIGIEGFLIDTTAVQQLKVVEAQLAQAQRLESIGRLAGGVAHDFNNLLTVINGYSQLTLERLRAGDPMHANIVRIHEAGERAATLTRQLLAFSRRQMLLPTVIDLNTIVHRMEGMLRPLIGEDIDLLIRLDPALGRVKVDAGQIEQVIMNLAVNARDAMPGGGKLSIETANIEPEDAQGPERAGAHVMLAVSDTGIGMDAGTQSQIFEPFFTTKPMGKGTGLGLSTVHGIVKQSGGEICVRSEPDRGTTFRIYLPRVEDGNNTRLAVTPAQRGAA